MNVSLRVLLFALFFPFCAFAAPGENPYPFMSDEATIPAALLVWRPWVISRIPQFHCPLVASRRVCSWPGEIVYTLTEKEARFSLDVTVMDDDAIRLPTLASSPVHDLRILSKADNRVIAPLYQDDGSLLLSRGSYRIYGALALATSTDTLPIRPEYGLFRVVSPTKESPLSLDRSESLLTLSRSSLRQSTSTLSMKVYRHIIDSHPVKIETRILLKVSGPSRSVAIGNVVLQGSTPLTIETPLPHQLGSDGVLSLQVVPGDHVVTLHAAAPQPYSSIVLPLPSLKEWPSEEIIVWDAPPQERIVEIEGGTTASPELVSLPKEWAKGAPYIVAAGGSLALKERSRGEIAKKGDGITMDREIWLDFSGNGLTFRDSFFGWLGTSHRLNALPVLSLTRATGGDTATSPLLVAQDPFSGETGVEVRSPSLNIQAVSRMARTTVLPVSGWNHTLASFNARLWLPPSWKLLWTSDTISAPQSWVSSWSLLELFLSILVIVATYHFFGGPCALLVLCGVFINQGEFLAPRFLFVHLILLAAWQRVLSKSGSFLYKLVTALLTITFIAWTSQSVAFMKLQLTQLLFPQLESGTRYRTSYQELASLIDASFLTWPLLLFGVAYLLYFGHSLWSAKSFLQRLGRLIGGALIGVFLLVVLTTYSVRFYGFQTAGSYTPAAPLRSFSGTPYNEDRGGDLAFSPSKMDDKIYQQQKGKTFQSGASLPEWRWKSYDLRAQGAVYPDDTFSLVLLPPWATRALCLLRLLIVTLLGWIIFRRIGLKIPRLTPSHGALAVMMFAPSFASAQFPPTTLLEELERSVKAHECKSSRCATISEGHLRLDVSTFELTLRVSSQGRSAISLPGPLALITPSSVKVNNQESRILRRTDDDFLQVQLEHGESTLLVQGSLPQEEDAFSIQLRDKPLYFTTTSTSWLIEGVSSTGVPNESLRVTSLDPKNASTLIRTNPISLPQWIRAERRIVASDDLVVTTRVERQGNLATPLTTSIPLVPGEQVLSSSIRVIDTPQGKEASLSFPSTTSVLEFQSALPPTRSLRLTASTRERFSEEWLIACSSVVHCVPSGLPSLSGILNGSHAFRWLPFPGESIELSITPLPALPGDVVTVDNINHSISWAAATLEGTIRARLRVTEQKTLTLSLPKDATVLTISVDGTPHPISENASPLLFNPGSHFLEANYSVPTTFARREVVPEVSLGIPVHNLTVTIEPGTARWLLFTGGGSWGPAVLIWSKILFIALFCVAASSLGYIPVSLIGSLLLAVGLSTLPLIVIAFPLTWLFILGLWPSLPLATKEKMNVSTKYIVIICSTIGALVSFYAIVRIGLLLHPPMLIAGNQSTASLLRWTFDYAPSSLPRPWVLSTSLFWWRTFALIWSLWLVLALIRWMKRTTGILKEVR
jgi:hypothetical protein